ncbi:MAG: glutaredoxin domain-containing protein [Sphingomicrobium sp.]
MTKPTATLYRMVLPTHTCPYGVRARDLLEEAGFEIDEHILQSRDEVDAFQAEYDVSTTPQVFIDGERIGGSDELEAYLEKRSDPADLAETGDSWA